MTENTAQAVTVTSEENQYDIPEKFNGDVAALVKSYKELESKLGVNTPNEPQDASTGLTEPSEGTSGGTQIDTLLQGAELNREALQKTFDETGEIPEESLAKLYDLFGQDIVENYFSGLKAQAQASQSQASDTEKAILETVGGEDNWNRVSTWAAENAKEASEAFNSAIDRGDAATMKALASALKVSYEAVNGSLVTTSVKSGATTASTSAGAFADESEMIKAIQDPRYKVSAAYRSEVEKRIAKTKFG